MNSIFENIFTKQIFLPKTRSVRRAVMGIHRALMAFQKQGAESFRIEWDEDRKRVWMAAFMVYPPRGQYPGTSPKTKPKSAQTVFNALIPNRYKKQVGKSHWAGGWYK